MEASIAPKQAAALNNLHRSMEDDPRWRDALSQLPVNKFVDLSPSVWTSQNLVPPSGILTALDNDFALKLLEGEHSPHLQGKPVIACFDKKDPGEPLLLSQKPLPQFYRDKQDMLNSFVDFSYGKELPKWPLEIFLEISNICDFKCAMCPTFSAINPKRFSNLKKVDRGLLEISDASEPLEELLKHALIVHAFGYGEPTIHPNFHEFIDHLSRFEVMIDFFSHGKHLSQEMCEFLVNRKISRVTISFSGSNEVDYENIYIGGKYQDILDGIDRLNKTKLKAKSSFPQIHVNSIAFNHHIKSLVDFVHIMGKRGVEQVNIKPLSTYDSMPELHAHTSIMRKNIEGDIIDKAKFAGQQYGLVIESSAYERQGIDDDDLWGALEGRHKGGAPISKDLIAVSSFKELAKTKEKIVHTAAEQQKSAAAMQKAKEHFMLNKKVPCFEPLKTFYASFDGKVFPCCFKASDSYQLGNLKTDHGIDIWNNKPFTEIREKTLENKYRADICATCLRSNAYPHHHSVPGRFALYKRWFSESFNMDFDGKVASRIMELPDNEGILQRRKRCEAVLPILKEALIDAGLSTQNVNGESDMNMLRLKNPTQFSAAMKAFHPRADALTRKEYIRCKVLSFLPNPGKRNYAAFLFAAITIGIGNIWVASSPLALLELTIIATIVALVVCRKLLRGDEKMKALSADRFLYLLSQSTT